MPPTTDSTVRIAPDVTLGANVILHAFVNLYGCRIGDETRIGTFVEIQRGVVVGKRCKISSHSFLCEGVTLEDEVFIGHGVTFTNDRWPRAVNTGGKPQGPSDWTCVPTRVARGASIGSGTTILCGVTVGARAIIGAGSVVTRDVPPDSVAMGNPARVTRLLPSLFAPEP